MDIVDTYLQSLDAIFQHVGYVENWRAIPVEDSRNYFWAIDEDENTWCKFSSQKEALEFWLKQEHEDEYGSYGDRLYKDSIFTYWHLKKWVYRGPEFTIVIVDTHTDGNKFLRIFRNDHEIKLKKAASRG